MKTYLTFHLYGAMAAWGDTAVGEFRPSHSHPSRTAITGLIAAALGIRRDEEQRLLALDKNTEIAIRMDAPGEVLRDYHTIQVPTSKRGEHYYTRADELSGADLNTILSTRDYRCDAAATIALNTLGDEFTVTQIQSALQQPKLPLYLGRKSCPLGLPLSPTVIDAENLAELWAQVSLAQDEFAQVLAGVWGYHDFPTPERIRVFWESEDSGLQPDMSYTRRDRLRSRRRWQFTDRKEFSAHIASKSQHAKS